MSSPAPSPLREPYTIERYPAVNGGVRLVGFGADGTAVIDVTMPLHRLKPSTIDKLRAWMQADESEHPARPVLHLG